MTVGDKKKHFLGAAHSVSCGAGISIPGAGEEPTARAANTLNVQTAALINLICLYPENNDVCHS